MNPEDEKIVADLARAMPKMPRPLRGHSRFERILREVITAPRDRKRLPAPTPQTITQADIEEALRKLHAENG